MGTLPGPVVSQKRQPSLKQSGARHFAAAGQHASLGRLQRVDLAVRSSYWLCTQPSSILHAHIRSTWHELLTPSYKILALAGLGKGTRPQSLALLGVRGRPQQTFRCNQQLSSKHGHRKKQLQARITLIGAAKGQMS